MLGNRVSGKKIADVIKGNHTDDLAGRESSTEAMATLGNLVTPEILRAPQTEDVVLASGADLDDAAYMKELKFNEEVVEITIAEDSNEFPIDPVSLSVNGKQIFIKRGEPTKIPRKFVECLTNPVLRVKTKKVLNNLGEDVTVLEQTRSLQFPFSLSDTNPKGKLWLRNLLTRG